MMKKILVSLCAFVFALLSSYNVLAGNDNVSYEKARGVAVNLMSRLSAGAVDASVDATLVYQIMNPVKGVPALYFFNVADKGFVVVSGCTAARPVVGFSDEGVLDNTNFPPNMMAWMEGYAGMVIAAQNEGVEPSDDVAAEWKQYDQEGGLGFGATKANLKLMTEKWGQGNTRYPTYNLYCPLLGDRYCVAGCVPTAMAQVMHYWQFPKVGSGSKGYRDKYLDENGNVCQRSLVSINFSQTFYDYANMPDKLTSTSDSVEIKASALLMFHAGVAIDANYGVSGTSASTPSAPNVMERYFKYKRGNYINRLSYVDTNWMSLIRSELDSHRPVIYRGSSPSGGGEDASGHAFVCHGYRSDNPNFFSFNWGWNGSADGWFDLSTVNGLTPKSYNFCDGQSAIFGLEPPDDSNIYVGIRRVEPVEAELYAAYPNPATAFVTVPYSVPQGATALLSVYDMSGKVVDQLPLVEGNNSVTINVSTYRRGVYVYRIGGSVPHKFIVQ